jgi:ribokinase
VSNARGPAVVVGQVGRDLVLEIDRLPRGGRDTTVHQRQEVLGGPGGRRAVAMVQLGCPVALVGVLGNDLAGDLVLAQAVADGVYISGITRRAVPTALLVDLVDAAGTRRSLAEGPGPTLLTAEDVGAVAPLLGRARAVVLQLQEPAEVVRAALAAAPRDALRVADGAPPDDRTRDALLASVQVLRMDVADAGRWVGRELDGLADVRAAAEGLCAAGPRVVSLATGTDGDLTVWREPGGRLGEQLVPLLEEAVDPVTTGSAAVAALTVALLRGADPATAAWEAGAAAALSTSGTGGRRRLDAGEVTRLADRSRRTTGAGARADARHRAPR